MKNLEISKLKSRYQNHLDYLAKIYSGGRSKSMNLILKTNNTIPKKKKLFNCFLKSIKISQIK